MSHLRIVTNLSVFTVRFPSLLLNSLPLLIRLIVGLFAVLVRKLPMAQVFKSVFVEHVLEAADAAKQQANSNPLVRIFQWLECHPLPDGVRRVIVFVGFAGFSLGELLTS